MANPAVADAEAELNEATHEHVVAIGGRPTAPVIPVGQEPLSIVQQEVGETSFSYSLLLGSLKLVAELGDRAGIL